MSAQNIPDDIREGDTVLVKAIYGGDPTWLVAKVSICYPPGTKYGNESGWNDTTLHIRAKHAVDPFASSYPLPLFHAVCSEIIELKVIER